MNLFDVFLPIFMAPKSIRDGFSRGIKIFPNKYAEINVSVKVDAFFRDVNVWLILDSNFPDGM